MQVCSDNLLFWTFGILKNRKRAVLWQGTRGNALQEEMREIVRLPSADEAHAGGRQRQMQPQLSRSCGLREQLDKQCSFQCGPKGQ